MASSSNPDSAARYQRVKALFEDALDLAADEREAFVRGHAESADVAQQVMALLASGGDDHELESIVADAAADVQSSSELKQIDQYRIIERIGEGGMGQVFLAERDDAQFQHRVAIKVLSMRQPGDDLIRRFRAERQILARLKHPYIAQLHDGGATPEGLPYLVMEHVEGLPVDEYCQRHALGLSDRLTLFGKICESIDYAHRSLIIHRDIKPSNILITEDGNPKLLDFGIAKLIGETPSDHTVAVTRVGTRALTLDYASPEQVRSEPVTTATDVYALGILLYRLLTGCSPYSSPSTSVHLLEREICESDPEKPSLRVDEEVVPNLRKRLAGDLDTIVLKALRKEPPHRYATPREMMDDIGRYQRHEPVAARAGNWRYRATKFVRRHAAGVAFATALALTIGSFLVVTLQQNQRIERERDAATRLANFMGEIFYLASPEAVPGETVTVEQVLDMGQERIQSELANEPRTKARLLWVMGEAYTSLGLHNDALRLMTQSAELGLEGHLPDEDLVDVLANLGQEHSYLGNFDKATDYFETAERVYARIKSPPVDLGTLLLKLHAMHLSRANRTEEGLEKMLDAERMARAIQNDVDHDHADVMHNLGTSYLARGDNANAEMWLRRSLERKDFDGTEPCNTCAVTLGVLAIVLRNQDRPAEALAYSERALDILERVLGPEHMNAGITWGHIGRTHLVLGNLEESDRALARSFEIITAALDPGHYRIGAHYGVLGELRVAQGRLDDARAAVELSLSTLEGALPDTHRVLAAGRWRAGLVYRHRGEHDQSLRELERALKIYETEGIASGQSRVLMEMGLTHMGAGRNDTALSMFDLALALHPSGVLTARIQQHLGSAYVAAGDCASAVPVLEAARATLTGEHHARRRLDIDEALAHCHRSSQ